MFSQNNLAIVRQPLAGTEHAQQQVLMALQADQRLDDGKGNVTAVSIVFIRRAIRVGR